MVDLKRLAELQKEVGNLTDAIATDLLTTSPALAQRLATAEAELAKLHAVQIVAPPVIRATRLLLAAGSEHPLGPGH